MTRVGSTRTTAEYVRRYSSRPKPSAASWARYFLEMALRHGDRGANRFWASLALDQHHVEVGIWIAKGQHHQWIPDDVP